MTIQSDRVISAAVDLLGLPGDRPFQSPEYQRAIVEMTTSLVSDAPFHDVVEDGDERKAIVATLLGVPPEPDLRSPLDGLL